MKKSPLINNLLLGIGLLSILNMAAQPLYDPAPQVSGNTMTISFANLGYPDANMVGPIDSTRKAFNPPPNWKLLPGGFVEIVYDVIISGADVALLSEAGISYSGSLTVLYNSRIIGQIRLDKSGSYTQRFQIPAEAAQSVRQTGEHELEIRLIAQSDCVYDVRTFATIKSVSHFELPFEITSPTLDLSRLPAPFYLDNSLMPDRTIIVSPDSPSIQELQASLNIMAGFGSLVGRAFDIKLTTVSQLSPDMLVDANLIFVGTPDDFPLLQNANFPTRIANGRFINLPAESQNDGVVELALSPWNSDKVVMLISGISDDAVGKAAAAVSSGRIFVYQNPQIVYISDAQDLIAGLPLVETFTLQDLGYENATLEGIGVEREEYSFFVSKEQVSSQDGLITLAYYHSGLLDYGMSSLTVLLNGEPIASQPFSAESEQYTLLPIKIPPGLLRYGENRLVMSTSLEPDLSCDISGLSDPWITISNKTSIEIPVGEAPGTLRAPLLDLKFFPAMFISQSDLGDLSFILAENDPSGWQVAANLAYNIGEIANPVIPHIAAAYAGNVPENIRSDYSMIFVGRPNTLPLLAEFNDSLPAPFDFATGAASERQMQIVYRLPPGVNVGYLELIPSPYNSDEIILIASGNTNEGVLMAGDALINEQLKDILAGQFAVTNGVQVAVGSGISQFSIIGTIVPSSNAVVATPLPAGSAHTGFTRPLWLLPALIASGVLVLAVVVLVVLRSLNKDKLQQLETPADDEDGRKK